MEHLGLVGLADSGHAQLFSALTGSDVATAADRVLGVVHLPDERVDRLAEMSKSKKVVNATVELVDIAGLVAGASSGEGLGNRFLAGIREVDAVILVLRAFQSDEVAGGNDPLDDLHTLELELVLADVASVEGLLYRRRKAAKNDKDAAAEVPVLEAALHVLNAGAPVYRSSLTPEQRTALRPSFLLTNKPVLAVVNLGEDDVTDADAFVKPVAAELGDAAEVLGVSVQLEAETAQLDAGERAELLEGLGLGEGALPRVVRAAYHLLGRRTFLTTGDKESRAWTFRAGAKAPECAGVIHSDLQRGFIRAEVIRWDELLELGSWAAAKDAGRLRVEGKDYEVADGDTLEIRFNV